MHPAVCTLYNTPYIYIYIYTFHWTQHYVNASGPLRFFQTDPIILCRPRPMVVLAPQKFALLFTLGRGLGILGEYAYLVISCHILYPAWQFLWVIQQTARHCRGSLCFLGSFSALRGHSAFLRLDVTLPPMVCHDDSCYSCYCYPGITIVSANIRRLHSSAGICCHAVVWYLLRPMPCRWPGT